MTGKEIDYDFGLQMGRMEEGINTLLKQQKETKRITTDMEARLRRLETDVAKIAQWKTDIAFSSLSTWTKIGIISAFVTSLVAIIINIILMQ